MSSTIAHTYLYNIIFIFLAIIFAFAVGIVVYYRSFKINKEILSIIEKYEGYNVLSKKEIDKSLGNIGYNLKADKCPKKGQDILYSGQNNMYCVYYFKDDKNNYYTYGVITYLSFDLPVIGDKLKLPIYTKSNRIFKFGDGNVTPKEVS